MEITGPDTTLPHPPLDELLRVLLKLDVMWYHALRCQLLDLFLPLLLPSRDNITTTKCLHVNKQPESDIAAAERNSPMHDVRRLAHAQRTFAVDQRTNRIVVSC